MISYYDLRAARNAMETLQNKPLRRRKLDIHFSIPKVRLCFFHPSPIMQPCNISNFGMHQEETVVAYRILGINNDTN